MTVSCFFLIYEAAKSDPHSSPRNSACQLRGNGFICLQNLTRNGRPTAELFRPKVRPTESVKTQTSQISYKFGYLRQFKYVWASIDYRNQQNAPFSKLHIKLLKQFEGSRTSTNFIEPLLPKNRTEQSWQHIGRKEKEEGDGWMQAMGRSFAAGFANVRGNTCSSALYPSSHNSLDDSVWNSFCYVFERACKRHLSPFSGYS